MTEPSSLFGKREERFVDLWLLIIVNTTIIALLISILAFHYGTAAVAANLLYIPIVIAAYWYPRWGIWYAAGVCVIFIGIVMVVTGGQSAELAASFFTCLVIIGVAAVVSSLASHMRKNEVKYQGIFDHSEAGIGLVNSANHVIEEVNRRFADTLGYEPAEIAAKPFPQIGQMKPTGSDSSAALRPREAWKILKAVL